MNDHNKNLIFHSSLIFVLETIEILAHADTER